MSNQNLKLTIIILDYMKAARVVENVKKILEQAVNFEYKFVVIDNSCNEQNASILRESLKNYGNVELIINPTNTGYIKAHNTAAENMEGDYLLIVNPDILMKEKDTIQKLVDYMDRNPDIGVLGPKQVNDNGEIAMTVRAWPKFYLQVARRTFLRNMPIFKQKVEYDEMKNLDYSKIQDVDWLQSSCVIVRKDLWQKCEGLDESYFLFMSDPELCLDSWRNNYRVVYYPDTKVYADGKRVSAGGFLKFFQNWVLRQHVKDSLTYRFKHFFETDPRKKYHSTHKI